MVQWRSACLIPHSCMVVCHILPKPKKTSLPQENIRLCVPRKTIMGYDAVLQVMWGASMCAQGLLHRMRGITGGRVYGYELSLDTP